MKYIKYSLVALVFVFPFISHAAPLACQGGDKFDMYTGNICEIPRPVSSIHPCMPGHMFNYVTGVTCVTKIEEKSVSIVPTTLNNDQKNELLKKITGEVNRLTGLQSILQKQVDSMGPYGATLYKSNGSVYTHSEAQAKLDSATQDLSSIKQNWLDVFYGKTTEMIKVKNQDDSDTKTQQIEALRGQLKDLQAQYNKAVANTSYNSTASVDIVRGLLNNLSTEYKQKSLTINQQIQTLLQGY